VPPDDVGGDPQVLQLAFAQEPMKHWSTGTCSSSETGKELWLTLPRPGDVGLQRGQVDLADRRVVGIRVGVGRRVGPSVCSASHSRSTASTPNVEKSAENLGALGGDGAPVVIATLASPGPPYSRLWLVASP